MMMAEDKTKAAPEPVKPIPIIPEKSSEPQFSGREIIRATGGSDGDILSILLELDKLYTENEFKKILKDFKEKEVKPKEEEA